MIHNTRTITVPLLYVSACFSVITIKKNFFRTSVPYLIQDADDCATSYNNERKKSIE